MAETLVIETVGLRKHYGTVDALSGLDLQVPAGSICGFLGRNGAGKTTTIKVLLGMTRPSAGTALVFGRPADVEADSIDIRRRTGFVSDEKDLYEAMTVDAIVGFTSRFFPAWRDDLEALYLKRFELPRDRPVKALSRGMRTKLALVLALCRDAELLILDEPTAGLDPAVIEELLQTLVGHVAGQGTTVLFSTHQIAEVDQIADRVAIIDNGRIAVAGGLDDLRAQYRHVQLTFDADAPDVEFQSPGVVRTRRYGRVLRVLTSAGPDAVLDEARRLDPLATEVSPVTLKDIFLETVVKGDRS